MGTKTADERCFGKYTAGHEVCLVCEYKDSCQYITLNDKKEKPSYHVSYETVSNCESLTDYDHTPGDDLDEEITAEDERQAENLVSSLAYILRMDDYALGILQEIVAPSDGVERKRRTIADIARIHGTSRQAVHQKSLRVIQRNPELANTFKLALLKIRKVKREFNQPYTIQKDHKQPELF